MLHSTIARSRLRLSVPRGPKHQAFNRALQQEARPRPKLNLSALDKQWRQKWASKQEHNGWHKKDAEKMYILPMFPYPSGDLHLGHLRVYTISDVLARYWRMQGREVMHPIGWDAFGLPAENAAIERGIDPETWTKSNIKKMKSQLEAMNGHWDWEREFATCDPTFYKHTQRLFLLLHERGLAYQAESLVNYDPVDKTVLANEQVDANGCSWRSGAKVEQRRLKQWFLKISEFREDLLKDLEYLAKDGAWPERVLAMQRNWLGRSTGARIKFPVVAYNQSAHCDIEVFTTRPDTLFGVQYLALASTHPIVQELRKTDEELQAFLDSMPQLLPDTKAGYLLPDLRAINPLSYDESTPDATKASLPIYIASYVLSDYGEGAVMGVPGHDTRDHAFWKHNQHNVSIRMAISPSPDGSTIASKDQCFVHPGYLTASGAYSGQTTAQASKNLLKYLERMNLGSAAESWRLRDWLVSRQRYWGTPIPIIHCNSCGPVPVPEDQLPVELPSVEGHWIKGKAGNPLDHAHDWVNTTCPRCHGPAKRDTDTMDTFVDSSWYFMRFIDPKNENMLFSSDLVNESLPVDIYIGGVEHAILHLLYARFISKFIASTPLWDSTNHGEPFKQVLTQGMVHGKTYSDPETGKFLKPDEVDLTIPSSPTVATTRKLANVSYEKMSKSKWNGVDPTVCIAEHGADAVRAHMLFQAPVSEVLDWDEEKISGITRWLRRIHDFVVQGQVNWTEQGPHQAETPKSYFLRRAENISNLDFPIEGIVLLTAWDHHPTSSRDQEFKIFERRVFEKDKELWRAVQSAIGSVTKAYSETHSLNTVVSDLMALTNMIVETRNHQCDPSDPNSNVFFRPFFPVDKYATRILLQMMAPITPAFAEECWAILHSQSKPWGWRPYPGSPLANVLDFFDLQGIPNGHKSPMSDIIQFFNLPGGLDYGYPSDRRSQNSSVSSIFSDPFPTQDGTFELLAPQTQKCAVQVNGKLKFVVDLLIPPETLEGKELEEWMLKEILGGEEGATKVPTREKIKKVIVARGGRTVNLVLYK